MGKKEGEEQRKRKKASDTGNHGHWQEMMLGSQFCFRPDCLEHKVQASREPTWSITQTNFLCSYSPPSIPMASHVVLHGTGSN